MVDVLQSSFDVVVENETYTFRMPDIRYRVQLSSKAVEVRRKMSPEAEINERLGIQLDWASTLFSRACAILELYLEKATVTWVYGEEDATKIDLNQPPKVDCLKFPLNRDTSVEAIGVAFEDQMNRFRQRGN